MNNKRIAFFILFGVVFIDMIGFGMIIPLLPYYGQIFAEEIASVGQLLGLDAQPEGIVIAVLFSLYSIMQLIFSPIWGRLSDRYGRKPILAMNALGSVVAFIIFGIAGTLWILLLSRVIQGITGAKIATAQAYISDITEPEKRARGMGMIGAGIGLGFVFGPAITGILINFESSLLSVPWIDIILLHKIYTLPGYFSAFLAFINFIFIMWFLPEPVTHSETRFSTSEFRFEYIKRIIRNKEIFLLLAIIFLSTTAFSAMEATFALWGQAVLQINEKTNSYLFAYIGVLIAVNQGLIVGRLAEALGEKTLIIIGTGCLMVGLLLTPFSPSISILMLVLVLLAFGSGVNTPSLQSLVSKSSKDQEIGATLGISQSISSSARIVGPLIGGWAFDILGVSSPFLVGSAIMFFAVILGMGYYMVSGQI